MKKIARNFLVFVMTALALASAQQAKTGTWFQQITNSSNNGLSVLNKYFHRCSLNEQCNFVVKNLKTNFFKEVSDEKDLPTDKNVHAIWKKIPEGKFH